MREDVARAAPSVNVSLALRAAGLPIAIYLMALGPLISHPLVRGCSPITVRTTGRIHEPARAYWGAWPGDDCGWLRWWRRRRWWRW